MDMVKTEIEVNYGEQVRVGEAVFRVTKSVPPGGSVRFVIEAPDYVKILRSELIEREKARETESDNV